MKPWQVTLESLGIVFLWLINAIGDIMTCFVLLIIHEVGGWVMLGVLGLWHFLLNGSVFRVLRSTNMNKCGLLMLLLTQTGPFYLLCRRAWRSLVPCCARDDRTKKRKALIAKYSLCCQTLNKTETLPLQSAPAERGSCIPSDFLPDTNDISTTISNPSTDAEADDSTLDQLFCVDEDESQQIIPMGNTKFAGNTHDIKLNFSAPAEVYTGEPSVAKFLMKSLQLLFVDEKKLSYHIVTDAKNNIIYVTKSDQHILYLPSRIPPLNRSAICNDIHYAFNLVKGTGFEVFSVKRRNIEKNNANGVIEEETNIFNDADLSRLIWGLVWPSAVIKLYTILDVWDKNHLGSALLLLSPLVSIITWLLTQRGVTEPWRNTAILVPLRITMTVPRALLVIGITLTNITAGVFCFISVKSTGIVALVSYLTYSKKRKNIELYRDEIDRYTFNPIFEPVIQLTESIVYILWSIWWYSVHPRSEVGNLSKVHFPLIFLLTTLLGHVFGLTWLWFARSWLKKPLKDPRKVLKLIQSFEYIRT